MKKTVKVVKEFEYEIEIIENLLTQQFVDEFEKSFWELDGEDFEDKISNLFEVAAYQLANGESSFIEGLGDCSSKQMLQYRTAQGKKYNVVYDNKYEETETEVI